MVTFIMLPILQEHVERMATENLPVLVPVRDGKGSLPEGAQQGGAPRGDEPLINEPRADEPDDDARARIEMKRVLYEAAPVALPSVRSGAVTQSPTDSAAPLRSAGPIPFAGRMEVDVLVAGIDARLGRTQTRADALHLLTFHLQKGTVHITSIPRGTHVDLGFADPSGNIISHVRSTRGRDALLRTVARVCGRPSVEWYVEVGFSQAIGILELLGYADPMVELQALRKRKGYQQGDRNRSWNQGEFIRRAIMRELPMFEGMTGGMLLDAGMLLVDTNVPRDVALGLIYTLNDARVTERSDAVTHSLHGAREGAFVARDADSAHAVADGRYATMKPTTTTRAESVLRSRLREAKGSESRPRAVRGLLWQIVQQRGWLQIPDRNLRSTLRDSLCAVLDRALAKEGDEDGRARVRTILRTDDQLFRRASASTTGGS